MSDRSSTSRGGSQAPHRSRRIHEELGGKLRELARCPMCGASYREGRWTWKKAPADAYEHKCPACVRVEESYPAGVVHVGGAFVASHREELVGLIRNVEQRERREHPLKRIMELDDEGSGFRVTVTDAKLAHTIGRSLERAHQGRLESQPAQPEAGDLVRVSWTRD